MLALLAVLVGAFVVLFMCGAWDRSMRRLDEAKQARERREKEQRELEQGRGSVGRSRPGGVP